MVPVTSEALPPRPANASSWQVFVVFLRLGLTSFGGPVAHLAFFRTEFVERRRWLGESRYAEIVALCQFLPGPASSQVGMALGWQQAGWRGSLAAWLGFTLPSALLMAALALGLHANPQWLQGGLVHGVKLAAVAVIAHALWSMGRSLCPDVQRAVMAVLVAGAALASPGVTVQWLAMLLCGAVGAWALRESSRTAAPQGAAAVQETAAGAQRAPPQERRVPMSAGLAALALFFALLLGGSWVASTLGSATFGTFDAFFRAGGLVFGGGHVVLPLLQTAVVPSGAVSAESFLAGYGAAQAMPGPLFTFASYLGAALRPEVAGTGGIAGAVLCTLAIFLPAWLLVVGTLPFWDALRRHPGARAALAGVNAGVVGLLAAALVGPVGQQAVSGPVDLVVVAAAWALLAWARLSPPLVVALAGLAGLLLA